MVMMGVRIVCFGLMVLVTPYAWYTWVFAAGAIVIPYVAVVIANVSSANRVATVMTPQAGAVESGAADGGPHHPTVITVDESIRGEHD